jgi:uncharacterized protein (DUF1697 family)
MTINIALLRSINLGSYKKVAMDDLREVFTELGFSDVRSVLQTGNVVFQSQSRTTARLEGLLETEVEKRLAVQTDFFVRTDDEWKAVVSHNPFREEARRDRTHAGDARTGRNWNTVLKIADVF